ncbi:unnamed protein product [Caenorhabditis angaria]|uniref:DDHD domain-containing protein n=1 Tax=Caenorhabditis angaria TaxID=860376 RepID=A0A9P1MZ77_9PELO|nr:unnamed protein product [Caenorhabditis angaria]
MLIKEYRILLPMTVDEYRIAQLYMIQKKSRLDSHGKDSGVEIISNKPYSDGPGKSGQYTFKIYHVGSRIPAWIRTVLPTNALEAHEEAWNAYPQTKTRYSTPMMDRFSLEVETLYFDDDGRQENVFNLKDSELRSRVVDYMDFVKDPISNHDYATDEDPKLFKSTKTGRGPLSEDWVEEHRRKGLTIMCAYKLCRVEFRYWGMQTRAERWIHDLALRNTMLRAHRQAWAWQDEWDGLTMDDIRKLEDEAAVHLSKVMADKEGSPDGDSEEDDGADAVSDDLYFDCTDGSPPPTQKPSIIRWSSELELEIQGDGEMSPPLTPANAVKDAALLIIVFHGDFAPENPADSKTTDTNTFGSTIETCVQRHYPQLKGRLHILNVSCGSEMSATIRNLTNVSPSFGVLHPSLALMLPSASHLYNEAVEGTIRRANETYAEFINTQPNFNGEVFLVGDCVGGIFLYEAMTKKCDFLKRHSSTNIAARIIKEHQESSPNGSLIDLSDNISAASLPANNSTSSHQNGNSVRRSCRNYSAPPSASYVRKKISLVSVDSVTFPSSRLNFQPSTVFLLGCPLGLALMQKKLEAQDIETLDSCQLFNLYYPLDPCGARIEPVLNSQLAYHQPHAVPKYQRYPLGDGKSQHYDSTIDRTCLWGSKRIDNLLYCPNAMIALPSTALPNILHASYWESCDVAAFLLRQFVRSGGDDDLSLMPTLSSSMNNIPLNIDLPQMHWKRRRTRFKIANLAANHRANDLLVTAGMDINISAKFCYGPMDLVALSREAVSVFVCPQRGEWYLHGVADTDSHGRLQVQLAKSLPCGIHSIKIVVHGDRSYLDTFVAVVPPATKCAVFSVDGSLTASVSVSGKDPRVRAGAVDVVRYWQEQGYLIIYMTARPDMQQRVVSAWLAQHNFPHALLFFNNSISTEPLKQKTLLLRHLIDMGVQIHVAYGSSKDVSVYTSAGIEPEHVISVSGGSRRRICVHIDNYSSHLLDLQTGHCVLGQRIEQENNSLQLHRNVQRTPSFTPRGGKFENEKELRK